jgi:hypothetical protein
VEPAREITDASFESDHDTAHRGFRTTVGDGPFKLRHLAGGDRVEEHEDDGVLARHMRGHEAQHEGAVMRAPGDQAAEPRLARKRLVVMQRVAIADKRREGPDGLDGEPDLARNAAADLKSGQRLMFLRRRRCRCAVVWSSR